MTFVVYTSTDGLKDSTAVQHQLVLPPRVVRVHLKTDRKYHRRNIQSAPPGSHSHRPSSQLRRHMLSSHLPLNCWSEGLGDKDGDVRQQCKPLLSLSGISLSYGTGFGRSEHRRHKSMSPPAVAIDQHQKASGSTRESMHVPTDRGGAEVSCMINFSLFL